jgi:hypothetical protein
MGRECGDEMEDVLVGQKTDVFDAEREASKVQAHKVLAALPEASTLARRSKRRASTADQSSLSRWGG